MRASGSCAGKINEAPDLFLYRPADHREPGLRTERKQRKRFPDPTFPSPRIFRRCRKRPPLPNPLLPRRRGRRAAVWRGLGGQSANTLRDLLPTKPSADAGKRASSPQPSPPGRRGRRAGSLRGLGGQSANTLRDLLSPALSHRMERGIRTRASARRGKVHRWNLILIERIVALIIGQQQRARDTVKTFPAVSFAPATASRPKSNCKTTSSPVFQGVEFPSTNLRPHLSEYP